MKIGIDIGHPAHVHYFKKIINILLENNIDIYVTARDKEITFDLLKENNIKYHSRGKGGVGLLGKIFYLFKAEFILYKYYKSIKPDIFLSFGSSYLAHVAKMLNKKHIVLDDTEHAVVNQFLYKWFSDYIITPSFFKREITKNQIRWNCFFEQFYLKDYVFIKKNILNNRKNILIRFVSWNAVHDINQKQLSLEEKINLVTKLSKDNNIYISSEIELPKSLKKYELNIPKNEIHNFMTTLDLFISESGTMASEASLLGIPTILTIDKKLADKFGNFQKLQQYNLLKVYFNINDIISQSTKMLDNEYKSINIEQCKKLWAETSDPNKLLLDIISKELSYDITYSNSSKK